MKTVQLAMRDSRHARSLRDLLLDDGAHQVHLVKRPNMAIAGVIVMDIDHLDETNAQAGERERLVVLASKSNADLMKVWEAGVQHVVFHGDAPQSVRVAVLATELSLTAPRVGPISPSPEAADTQKSSIPPPTAFRESTRPTQCRARTAPPRH